MVKKMSAITQTPQGLEARSLEYYAGSLARSRSSAAPAKSTPSVTAASAAATATQHEKSPLVFKGKIDTNSNMYLIEVRSRKTGDVVAQYPSEKVVAAYKRGEAEQKAAAKARAEQNSGAKAAQPAPSQTDSTAPSSAPAQADTAAPASPSVSVDV